MTELPVSCDCGAVEGVLTDVSPKAGTHLVCYCSDCQAFAEYLGHSDAVLDANGGTDIYQTLPSRLDIRKGAGQLACVRVTNKGVLRWYASCCRAPIGNTASDRGLPFVGLVTACLRDAPDGTRAGEAMGPSRGTVFAKDAYGDVSDQPSIGKLPVVLSVARRVLGAKLSRDRHKTPFFTDGNQPVAKPQTLSADERKAIDERLAERRQRAQSEA